MRTTIPKMGNQPAHGSYVASREPMIGIISDGAGSIVIFDLKTNAVLGTVVAKDDADGIIDDKSTIQNLPIQNLDRSPGSH
jgi:hypothetical protein